MNSPGYRILLYGTALLVVLFAYSDANAQTWPPQLGGIMSCDTGKPTPVISPNIPVASQEWVGLMIHETAHVVQAYRNGGCRQHEARLRLDDMTRGHPYRLQIEAEAYCAERAAGFLRGDGTLRWVALILSGSPVYRQWNWSTDTALRVLNRVCG